MSDSRKKGIIPVSPEADTPTSAPVALPAPNFAVLPLSYGSEMIPISTPGSFVSRDDTVSRAQDGFALASPFTGSIGDIRSIRHPFLGTVPAAAMLVSKESTRPLKPLPEIDLPDGIPCDAVISVAKAAGIIDETDGLPLYKKLAKAANEDKELVMADAAEDQPFSGAALSVLLNRTREVLTGLKLAACACDTDRVTVGVFLKGKRPPVSEAELGVPVTVFGPRYPSVYAKKEFLAKQNGVSFGVQALAALARAALLKEPQTHVTVSVGGNLPEIPRNIYAPLGTPLRELIDLCQVRYPSYSVVAGGSLTGKLCSPETPLSHCITAILPVEDKPAHKAVGCISCSTCCKVCPEGLLPIHIMKSARRGHRGLTSLLDPERCTGCGCCSWVCPSHIDLTAAVRRAADAKKDRRKEVSE